MDMHVYVQGRTSAADSNLRRRTDEVTTIGGPLEGQWKWHGGVLGADGAIYGIPCNSEGVLKIVPETQEVSVIGGPLPGANKWHALGASPAQCVGLRCTLGAKCVWSRVKLWVAVGKTGHTRPKVGVPRHFCPESRPRRVWICTRRVDIFVPLTLAFSLM